LPVHSLMRWSKKPGQVRKKPGKFEAVNVALL
jgi:hypothetical protein